MQESVEFFRVVQEAYEVLGDRDKRKRYDYEHGLRRKAKEGKVKATTTPVGMEIQDSKVWKDFNKYDPWYSGQKTLTPEQEYYARQNHKEKKMGQRAQFTQASGSRAYVPPRAARRITLPSRAASFRWATGPVMFAGIWATAGYVYYKYG